MCAAETGVEDGKLAEAVDEGVGGWPECGANFCGGAFSNDEACWLMEWMIRPWAARLGGVIANEYFRNSGPPEEDSEGANDQKGASVGIIEILEAGDVEVGGSARSLAKFMLNSEPESYAPGKLFGSSESFA